MNTLRSIRGLRVRASRVAIAAALLTLGSSSCSAPPEPPPDAGTPDPWTKVSVPDASADFHVVFAISDSDVWVGGVGSTLLHFDGTEWKAVATPIPSSATVTGIWGASSGDVWAVANTSLESSIFRWNGTTWTRAMFPDGSSYLLRGIYGAAADDIYAVGGKSDQPPGKIWRWNGIGWNAETHPAPAELLGVGGSGADKIWAAGMNAVVFNDGASWSLVNPGPTGALTGGVWGFASGDAWFTGEAGRLLRFGSDGWKVSTVGTARYHDVWGRAADDLWAVGSDGTAAHFDGSAWTPSPTGTQATLRSVHGAGSDVWAVGTTGTLLRHRK